MKPGLCVFVVLIGLLRIVKSPDGAIGAEPEKNRETVLITYHIITGKETELQSLLSRVWQAYRDERLVLAEPHVIVRDEEGGGKTRFVEVFTWVDEKAPDHAPEKVTKLWEKMKACC